MKIACVIYNQFDLLDLAGPVDVLRGWPGAELYYVAATADPVISNCGLTLQPSATLGQVPAPDIIFVPGTARTDLITQATDLIDWLRVTAPGARWITSVCTGAGMLAAAGLLRGKRATTHWAYRVELAKFGVEVVSERVVFDGNVVTGAGVSAGIDMALALLARDIGPDRAKAAQLAIEYDPQPPFDTGSPEKAGETLTKTTLAMLLATAARTAPAGQSISLAIPPVGSQV